MPDSYEYFTVRKHHEEIFKKPDPVSIQELIFVVEAPAYISKVNIWRYTEKINLDDICPDEVTKVSKEEMEHYPHYDLFRKLWDGYIITPFILESKDNELIPLEGKHRLRMLKLFKAASPDRFNKTIGLLDCVVVKFVETRDYLQRPIKFEEFEDFTVDHSWKNEAMQRREVFKRMCLEK